MNTDLKSNVNPNAGIEQSPMLPAVYVNRFFEERKIPKHLKFEKSFGDVIMLDGRYQLITGFGIYDNQMWTEKIFEDGCHLGAGNYEFVEKATVITDNNIRQMVIEAYKSELSRNSKYYSEIQVSAHLSQFS